MDYLIIGLLFIYIFLNYLIHLRRMSHRYNTVEQSQVFVWCLSVSPCLEMFGQILRVQSLIFSLFD